MILTDEDLAARPLDEFGSERLDRIAERVRQDFVDAQDARRETEARKLTDYALYRRKVREVAEETAVQDSGPFGWSRIQVPLVFWYVETQVPRSGVNPPTITVTARTPEAVAYAQAKQMRLQHHLHRSGWKLPYQMIQRSRWILGDGICKVPWDPKGKVPRIVHVDWFDFFPSAEATVLEAAEVMFHRSSLTRRQVAALAEEEGPDGKPVWDNLDDLVRQGADRSTWDTSWGTRLGYADRAGSKRPEDEIPFVEAWYRTGEYVVLGGTDYATLVRAQMSPFKTPKGDHVRPFAFFRGIVDLVGPYSMSLGEVLEDHQVELSTVRNQFIDQITGNINAPIAHDEAIKAEVVDEAFSQPNGRIATPGDPRQFIMRLPPGQVSGDFPMIYEQIRSESQMVAGVSDISAGQQSAEGLNNSTATGMSIIQAETNRRNQLMLVHDEMAMGDVARIVDSHDRQFCAALDVAVDGKWAPRDGAEGFSPLGMNGSRPGVLQRARSAFGFGPRPSEQYASGFARIGPECNGPGCEYVIEIDAGSSSRPDQMEEATKIRAFIQDASNPRIAPQVDWNEVTRRLVQVHGLSEEKLMRSPEEMAMQAAVEQAPPGFEPVGAPEPVQ